MRYLSRKIAFYVVAVWAAITLNFLLPRLIPGNPVETLLAREQNAGPVSPQERHALELLLGQGNGGLLTNYWHYLVQLAHFDLGRSVTYFPTPVATVISQSLPWTVVLVGVSTVLGAALGVAIGAVVGWRRGTWVDALIPSTTFLTAIPYFWLALVLLYVFASVVHLFPLNGGYNASLGINLLSGRFLASAAYHAVLPAVTIIVSSIGGWLLGMRNMMVTTMADDYVVAAEAKGIPARRVMMRYAARNAILPSVAGFAISLGFVVSGSIVMEIVFSYPGIGYQLLQAVSNDDYPLMQGIFLVITFAVLGANLLVDLLYGFVDPRIRQER